jgi:hypothetical protein
VAAHGARAADGKTADDRFLGCGLDCDLEPWLAAFVQRLHELGWVEGRTITVEHHWAEGRGERFEEITAEFIRLNVAVIVTAGIAVPAAKRATSAIPIVFTLYRTRSGAAWSLLSRDRAATSPDCRTSRVISSASALNSCARLSRASAAWRSWRMATIP